MDIVNFDQDAIADLLPEYPDALLDARAIVVDPEIAASTSSAERRLAWLLLLAARRTRNPNPRGAAA